MNSTEAEEDSVAGGGDGLDAVSGGGGRPDGDDSGGGPSGDAGSGGDSGQNVSDPDDDNGPGATDDDSQDGGGEQGDDGSDGDGDPDDNPAGELLAVGDGPSVELIDPSSLEVVGTLRVEPEVGPAPTPTVFALAHDAGTGQLAVGYEDGSIFLWSPEAGEVNARFTSTVRPTALAFHPTEPVLVVGGR